MRSIQILSIILFLTTGSKSLSLNDVSGPSSHPAGQDLTLDCDFSYQEAESDQLVLTWYFNDSPIPIYQWVPALDLGPQVIHEMFKESLDLTYLSHDDKLKKHSSLRITNPDRRFSGNYKCRVSTFLEEVSEQKEINIYIPPTDVSLTREGANISCQVESVFPLPSVLLVWTSQSIVFSSDKIEVVSNLHDPSLFDVSVAATIEEADIAPQDMMTCEVNIVNTDFVKRVEKPILDDLESELKTNLEVDLVASLCESADCYSAVEDEDEPVQYEAVENTLEVGAAVESLSEESVSYLDSSSSSNGFNRLAAGMLLALGFHWLL